MRQRVHQLRVLRARARLTDGKYQYYRSLEKDLETFEKGGFDLIEVVKHPDTIGAMYVFKKG